jgi:phospholipase/carboxylesterase
LSAPAPAELVHEIREPAGEAQGALILLHGRGTDEHDLFGFLDFLDPEKRLFGITPGAPITDQPPGGRHWYAFMEVGRPEPETFRASVEALASFLDSQLADRGIDWSDTVLGGFSQGGVMSYALGLDGGRPLPAGILAMSSFVPDVDDWEPDLDSRKGLPVMITHGDMDPMIPVDFGRQAKDLLEKGGLDVTYHESHMPHTIDPRLVPELAEWVKERTGGPS